ncbi:hypothetical protein BJX64DRAFT_281298 [Aspergillus heterothallicus]
MTEKVSAFACEPCRASKVGCDKARPQCIRCLRRGQPCSYTKSKSQPRARRPPQHKSERKCKKDASLDLRLGIPIACVRCRRLKVRCDRKDPCGRCVRSDRGHECEFPADSSAADVSSQSKVVIPLYKQTFHSEIHWSALVGNIENLLKHRRWPDHHHHVEQEQQFSSSDNFFGNNTSLANATRRTLLSHLPPRDIADSFIDSYLDIVEPAHALLHVPTFKSELEAFWDKQSSADDAWLSQLFAILALGCQLHHQSILSRTGTASTMTSLLFDTSRAFLQRTPYMVRPDMTSIRTMCLLVIFKQTTGLACLESAALWPITGLIVRLAVTMGLHLTTPICGVRSNEPAITPGRLWEAVILLDLRQSLAAGVPVIPPPGDSIAEPLFDPIIIADEPQTRKEAFPFPAIIYSTLPRIYKILELATSPQISLSYPLVASYDHQIKSLLKLYAKHFSSPATRFQWTTVNVFFRRILLALHSRLYQEPDAATQYPVSYWSSLECSLALLSEQRSLFETTAPTGASIFFTLLHQQSFFLAALTVCFHLVQANSPLVAPDQDMKYQGHARRTILELLGSCRDIWARGKGKSACHASAFAMVDSLLGILEGTRCVWQ